MKREFILCFISVGLDFIPYPGVIFSIRPQSLFGAASWNTLISLVLGVADSLGKYFGGFKKCKCFIEWTFGLQIVTNVGILVYYFTRYWEREEFEWLTMFIFGCLVVSWVRAGMCETYYTIETKKYINSGNSHIIGTLINYSIVTGIAMAGFCSLLVGYSYKWVYGS